jgi:hypothetical protein
MNPVRILRTAVHHLNHADTIVEVPTVAGAWQVLTTTWDTILQVRVPISCLPHLCPLTNFFVKKQNVEQAQVM